jgi:hypothetical protein
MIRKLLGPGIFFFYTFSLFGGVSNSTGNNGFNTFQFGTKQEAEAFINANTYGFEPPPEPPIDDVHFDNVEKPIDNVGIPEQPVDNSDLNQEISTDVLTELANRGTIDSDNDVPTLIEIRDKLTELSQQERGKRKIVSLDENGSYIIESESNNSLVTLADIHEELQKFNLKGGASNEVTESTNDQVDEAENEIGEFIDNFQNDLPEFEIVEVQENFDDFYIDIPDKLVEYAGVSTLNLFNPKETFPSLNIPSLSDLAEFVSLVIGLIAVWIYSNAILKLASKTITDWTIANESNAVTNYSILGNSVGAIGVKALKVTITLSAIGASFIALGAVLLESVDIKGSQGSITDVFTDIQNIIVSMGGYVAFAMYWFLKFAPIISIVYMVGQYWVSVFTLQAITLVANRSARIAS